MTVKEIAIDFLKRVRWGFLVVGIVIGAALVAVSEYAAAAPKAADVDSVTLVPKPPCVYASLFGCFKPHWDYETLGADGGSAGSGGDSGADGGDGDGGDNGGDGPGSCAY